MAELYLHSPVRFHTIASDNFTLQATSSTRLCVAERFGRCDQSVRRFRRLQHEHLSCNLVVSRSKALIYIRRVC
jgi:hypothetical protein